MHRLALLFLLFAIRAIAANCDSQAHHQFDFWIGDWDVFDVGGPAKPNAHVIVDRRLDGCALRERYSDDTGVRGESLTTYDAKRGVWHQTWMTTRGELLTIEGTMRDGAIVLDGRDATHLVHGSWKPEGPNVRETATRSTDGGKTWVPWFDLIFKPRPHTADEQLIRDLDTEYQAAVKRNDVATMDRLLAPGFTLVTGSGKVFSKQDLLQEARSGKTRFERQEDEQQTVRLFGDTAVITALLWEKGTTGDQPFDKKLWFSDTYVRTEAGWRYAFGQASSPLPAAGAGSTQ